MILDFIQIHDFHFEILTLQENVITFTVDNSSSVDVDNRKIYISS